MKYVITQTVGIVEKFTNDEKCKHTTIDKYVMESFDACMSMLFEVLDCPDDNLTCESIEQTFNVNFEHAKQIQRYYACRKKVYDDILNKLNNGDKVIEITLDKDAWSFNPHEKDFGFSTEFYTIEVNVID